MDQQNKQLYTLNAEIRLLERRKQDISSALERLDATHKEAYSQNTQIINELTKRKTELLAQIDQLREGLSLLTSAYDQAKTSLEDFKNKKWTDVEKEIEDGRQLAKTITSEAIAKKQEAEDLLQSAEAKQEALHLKEASLSKRASELLAASESLTKRVEEDARRRVLAEQEYNTLQETIKTTKETLAGLTAEKLALEEEIKKAGDKHDAEEELLTARFAEAQRREKENSNRGELLDTRAKEQEEEKRLIKDRREALDRAVSEMRAKGVAI